MKKILAILTFFAIPFAAFAQYNIIPQPSELKPAEGQFTVDGNTKIYVQKGNAELKEIAQTLVNQLNAAGGMNLELQESSPKDKFLNVISFSLKNIADKSLTDESYRLNVSKNVVQVIASKPKGAFYALQTLLQLLPPQIFSPSKIENVKWTMPACQIIDNPRYAYRGLMLDVGRHFFPVSFIKTYIDLLALHKMNQFHWHLTEDQGWRIEIKKYPKLTEIGSKRKETMAGKPSEKRYDGTPYGGFYTQDEIKEVVAYAKTKYVNVIPEIEMPGHALAALAAYPELGCTGGPYEVGTKWGVFQDVYCPTEQTFSFLEDVLTEVIALFPSQYIHIGGDECPKTTWQNSAFCQDLMKKEGLKTEHELQSYFIRRIDKFLTAKGKKMIGWDEILEGGLSPNAMVMSWRGVEGGIAAAKQKHDVIMTPTSHVYFDYYQADPKTQPLAIGGFLPLQKVYSFEPTPKELTADEATHILGVQGNLWTEYIATGDYAEYMAYPRACAVAEIGWSPKASRNYENFANHLKVHQERLKYLGVNFYPNALYNLSAKTTSTKTSPLVVDLQKADNQGVIRYTTDGSTPTAQAAAYQKPFALKAGYTSVRAATFSADGQILSDVLAKDFSISKSTGKNYTLKNKNDDAYDGGSTNGLTNGVKGEVQKQETWVGFNGTDLEAVVDLGEVINVNRVSVAFLRNNRSWVFLPTNVEILFSSDGKTFESIQKVDLDASPKAEVSIQNVGVGTGGVKARFIKVFAKNYGLLPENHPGKGNPAWLFADEIVVE